MINPEVYLVKYWIMMSNNERDETIINNIKQCVGEGKYTYELLLLYLGKILYINNYTDEAYDKFRIAYLDFDMDIWASSNIPVDTFIDFVKHFRDVNFNFELSIDTVKDLCNLFADVSDLNEFKQSVFNYIFSYIVLSSDYSDLEFVEDFTGYISTIDVNSIMNIPYWLTRNRNASTNIR